MTGDAADSTQDVFVSLENPQSAKSPAGQRVKWVASVIVVGVLLLIGSIFFADRQLNPRFDEAELGFIEVPTGTAIEPGAVLFASDTSGNYEIYVRPADGSGQVALTNDPTWDSWRPRLSPGRATALFYRSPAGSGGPDALETSMWMIAAEGGQPIQVLPPGAHGWRTQGGAEWSPTGDALVMMGERPEGMQVWVTSVDGRDVRNVVAAPGNNTDPSWSPDGQRVLYVACPDAPCQDNEREVFATRALAGSERVQITNDDLLDEQPQFSPDGRSLAVRSQVVPPNEDGVGAVWDIRLAPINRSEPPRRLVSDASTSGAPMWLDDQTIVFDRIAAGGTTADIVTVRVFDGSLTPLVTGPADEIFPSP